MSTPEPSNTPATAPFATTALRGGAATAALVAAWFVGFNMRSVLLSVPPVLGHLRNDLGISYTTAGLLTSVPVLVLGALALPGAALVRRLGAHRTVTLGVLALALGAAARALPGGLAPIFAGTVLLSAGIAIAQPGLPVMLQAWFPAAVQRASTLVTLGLLSGEVAGVGITGPVSGRTGGWRGTFVVWAVPAAVALAGWALLPSRHAAGTASGRRPLGPLLRSRLMWWVAVLFAAQSLVYFSSNTWIPTTAPGGSGSAAATVDLTVLNAVMLPLTLALTLTRRPFVRSRLFYLAASLAALAGTVGWMVADGVAGPLWAALLGIGASATFAGLLAYPPSVAEPEDVAPFAGMMLTVGYAAAFLGPVLGGAALDLMHRRTRRSCRSWPQAW